MKHYTGLILLLAAPLAGCTGLTFGENEPGQDTQLESGSIAVDPATETSFVLKTVDDLATSITTKTLYAVPPEGAGDVTEVADLSEYDDARILFPGDRILLMAERNLTDELRVLERGTFAELARKSTSARYAGTRTAPSGRFVAVADNASSPAPIHLIDVATLDIHAVPHAGQFVEAMWLRGSDRLLAIIFYQQETEDPFARILSWRLEDLEAIGFTPDETGEWPGAEVQATIDGAKLDLLFSFTWIGISPDDRVAVFPLVQRAAGEADFTHRLAVMDLQTGDVRMVDDAHGPVGFTPDGSTIVSYRFTPNPDPDMPAIPHLVLVDPVTLATEEIDVPLADLPSFFVTHDGNFVVAGDFFGDAQLILFDVDRGEATTLPGPALSLQEFVSRTPKGELWLVDEGLFRLDYLEPLLEAVPLGFTPEHINILRQRDRLVLDDPEAGSLVFFDPEALSVTAEVVLP